MTYWRKKLFAAALATALIAPAAAHAQIESIGQTECDKQGELWRLNLIQQVAKTGKKIKYNHQVDAWWGYHPFRSPYDTVEALQAWIAANPGNICMPDADWWLKVRKAERVEGRANAVALAKARADKLALLRANPTPSAREAKFARSITISGSDIPPRSAGGVVGYELGIDEVGKVTSCAIVIRAGNELDSRTCRIVLRASFDPARDARGMPIASKFRGKVTWPASE